MGQCVSGTLVVLPHRTISKGTPVWLHLAPKPLSMQGAATGGGDSESLLDTDQSPLPCRVFVGTDNGTAVEVSCAERTLVPLPAFAIRLPSVKKRTLLLAYHFCGCPGEHPTLESIEGWKHRIERFQVISAIDRASSTTQVCLLCMAP
jgi:hypothetical protein